MHSCFFIHKELYMNGIIYNFLSTLSTYFLVCFFIYSLIIRFFNCTNFLPIIPLHILFSFSFFYFSLTHTHTHTRARARARARAHL